MPNCSFCRVRVSLVGLWCELQSVTEDPEDGWNMLESVLEKQENSAEHALKGQKPWLGSRKNDKNLVKQKLSKLNAIGCHTYSTWT